VVVAVLCPELFPAGFHIIRETHHMIDIAYDWSLQEMLNEYGNDLNMKAILQPKRLQMKCLQMKLLSNDTTGTLNAFHEAIFAKWPKFPHGIGWAS
ncbi:hypothetical protein LOAG_08829, partial [Loa loa]